MTRTTESSNPNESNLFCLIRREWVAPSPEEKVRQALLVRMIEELGYPKELVAVEKALQQMPHLSLKGAVPQRRADIVCFGNGLHPEHSLYPLLVVECKAVKLTEKSKSQVIGYNHHLNAYFVALANQTQFQFGWFDVAKQAYTFIPFLPTYQQLMSEVRKLRNEKI